MEPWRLALAIWLLSALAMAGMWSLARRTGNLGYAPVGWAGVMTAAALLVGLFANGSSLMRALTALAGATWGMRLCLHLLHRTLQEGEDGRHRALRSRLAGMSGGDFLYFQGLALLAAVFSLPLIGAGSSESTSATPWTLAALLVWLVALSGETIADVQLATHRADTTKAGLACRSGVWARSRHPNYFFEWLHWFTYVFLAAGSTYAWMTWIGPVSMLACLLWITGIPWTEAQAMRSRSQDYARYRREVSSFLPRPAFNPAGDA